MENNKFKYNISILGDSISTYEGFNPSGYIVYYKEDRLCNNEMRSVEDTWWKQVINALDSELCVNNSFSGSYVSGESDSCGCSDARCATLHKETAPNLILIYLGTNDRNNNAEIKMDEPDNPKSFYGAYRTMLKKIKHNYPSAKIVCATLLRGRLKDTPGIEEDTFIEKPALYNEAIKKAVKEENCLLADLASFNEKFESLDCCHPTKNGHETLSKLWLKALTVLL